LNRLIPKSSRDWIFASSPDFADNTRALYEHINSKHPEINCIWLVNDKGSYLKLRGLGINSLMKKSFRGFIKSIRSKVIITSHNDLSSIITNSQIYINLWHGIPLKAIGCMDSGANYRKPAGLNHSSSILISTSATVNTLLGACFHVNSKQLFISGLPRNDNLFNPLPKEALSTLLKQDVSKFKKIAFYMPTFREGYLKRVEGTSLRDENLFRFRSLDLDSLRNFLFRNNILLICKLHPIEEELFKHKLDILKQSLTLLTIEDLKRNDTELYRVVANADLLVTDYSSVYFDYLLLKRPIIFTPTDLEEYQRKRGFLLEPYDFWTPGPKVVTQESLQEEILKSLNNPDYFRKERDTINDIINHYKDNRSCERVTNLIMEKLKTKVK